MNEINYRLKLLIIFETNPEIEMNTGYDFVFRRGFLVLQTRCIQGYVSIDATISQML